MSTPNNDSPPTQPWDEAPARELANRLGSEEPTKFINDRAFILRVCSAIILKFAPPDLTAEVARLKQQVEWMSNSRKTLAEWYQERDSLRAQLTASNEAIKSCIDYANGREDEWGSRARMAFYFLHKHLNPDYPKPDED